jgi:hypothetical protein
MIDVPTPGRLVRRDVVHVQDLLNKIVNLAEHENAHLFLPLGRRSKMIRAITAQTSVRMSLSSSGGLGTSSIVMHLTYTISTSE